VTTTLRSFQFTNKILGKSLIVVIVQKIFQTIFCRGLSEKANVKIQNENRMKKL